jgi:hypothetical protein
LERLAAAYGIEVHELIGPEMPKTKFPKRSQGSTRRKPKMPRLAL